MCCSRKGPEDEKTKKCIECCMTPKAFHVFWWGLYCVFFVIQVVLIFSLPAVTGSQYMGMAFNGIFVIIYILSLVQSDKVMWRSILSYTSDVIFVLGCIGYVLAAILLFLARSVIVS